jgi:hypothetical protein
MTFQGFHGAIHILGYSTYPPVIPNPRPRTTVGTTLGGLFTLVGYDAPAMVAPGQHLTVRLYWRAESPIQHDLTVFAQIHDQSGHRWAQNDGQPDNGNFPTHRWQVGAVVADDHDFDLPANMPPGAYALDVGWYDLKTMARIGRNLSYLRIPLQVVKGSS